jgi:hypothetical protein
MALADRVRRRWRAAWEHVSNVEVDALRDVVAWAEAGPWPAHRLAEEADVHPYDIRNFIAGSGHTRPRHGPGLRMLWFVTESLKQDPAVKPADILTKIELLSATAGRLAIFEPDSDYFFHHLQRLGLVNEESCRNTCERISGQYYSHRLSRHPGKIIRSHYEFLSFTPFNRLPHFINRLRYGALGDKDAVERTAEGQIMRLADTYVLLGFVYRGYRRAGRNPQEGTEYDGLQINLFPAGQIGRAPPSEIDGVFLSYVYNHSYEMGRTKLVRKAGRSAFDPDQVGEFTEKQIQELEPGLDLSGLKPDVSRMLNMPKPVAMPDAAILATCLSVMLTKERLSWNQPADHPPQSTDNA